MASTAKPSRAWLSPDFASFSKLAWSRDHSPASPPPPYILQSHTTTHIACWVLAQGVYVLFPCAKWSDRSKHCSYKRAWIREWSWHASGTDGRIGSGRSRYVQTWLSRRTPPPHHLTYVHLFWQNSHVQQPVPTITAFGQTIYIEYKYLLWIYSHVLSLILELWYKYRCLWFGSARTQCVPVAPT